MINTLVIPERSESEVRLVPLFLSCPSCGYEQEVMFEFYDNSSGSAMLQMLEFLMKNDDEDNYKFTGKTECANCGKEVFALLQVTSRS